MRFLRTSSTHRLLAALAGVVAAVVVGSAIAIAASGSGPVPPPKPLAKAVHAALAAPSVAGVTARVTFTDHLIDASDIQGNNDPLLSGGSGRLWVAPNRGVRLEIQSDNGDAQLVATSKGFWAYDPTSNTSYEGTFPADSSGADHGQDGLPTIAQIQSAISRLSGHATVSGATPTDVAGHPAYSARVSPGAHGGLLGGVALAWDAAKGVPLRFSVFARGSSAPVLELTATNISYGTVPASDFPAAPPAGSKIVKVDLPTGSPAKKSSGSHQTVSGALAVASHLSFPLNAPASAGGMQRSGVRLLGSGSDAGALVTYGEGLDGVAVIERPGSAKSSSSPMTSQGGGDGAGLSLPSVSVGGASGQELDTALGSGLQFTRSGVSYTVLGSVSPAAIKRVARAL